jgi:hypothetical protein
LVLFNPAALAWGAAGRRADSKTYESAPTILAMVRRNIPFAEVGMTSAIVCAMFSCENENERTT